MNVAIRARSAVCWQSPGNLPAPLKIDTNGIYVLAHFSRSFFNFCSNEIFDLCSPTVTNQKSALLSPLEPGFEVLLPTLSLQFLSYFTLPLRLYTPC